MIHVYQGSVEQGPMFFDSLDADALAIADPNQELFGSFGVERGGIREMFGLDAWRAGLRAVRRGHFVNRRIGDPWTLPTVVAIRDRSIVWEHRGRHAGDHPPVASIPDLLTGVRA